MKFLKYYDAGISDAVLYGLCEKFNISPKIMKIIISRGYKTEKQIKDFLSPNYEMLNDPFKLQNMSLAVERIKHAIEQKEKILIFGDYDVDGVSATCVMIKTFEKLSYKVNYYLPNRFVDGYGLTCAVLDKIKKLYNPNLIITVDCGISSYEEVEYAKTLGIEVIVTDHHEIPQMLPNTIVLNAKIENQEYPFRELCGTGLAFKLSQAMLGNVAFEFLPIVAIATISDIVALKDENRVLIKLGMALMEKHLPLGLRSLFKLNKLSCQTVTSQDIAFKIAPKLNASGRMGDAKDSLNLYLENNPKRIKKLIDEIIKHNTDRQLLCNVVYDECKNILKNENLSEMRTIVLASEKWDQGILGIVCARLLDEYNRPVFLFSKIGEILKGSARSLPEVNIHALLTDMKDILETFGGHTVAAGLTLKSNKFEDFKMRVNSYVNQNINDKVFAPICYYDEEITLDEINEKFVCDLDVLEPFGHLNQTPKFKIECGDVQINVMKNFKEHANIILGKKLNLVAFNYAKNYYKLKYAKTKNFIFEFQKSKYKSQFIKGLLKEIDSDYNLKENMQNLESFYVNQIAYGENDNAIYKTYEKDELLHFINKASLSIFGTCFVFFSKNTLDDFVANFDVDNIQNFGIGENFASNGFNSIIFAPSNISFAKNFNRIVFIDPILNKGYIKAINQISTAEIFLPKNQVFDKKIFFKIYTKRENFSKIYTIFKKIENIEFSNLESMYIEFYRNKINFTDFYTALLVFNELNLINILHTSTICVNTISGKKTELNKSFVYNFVNLIKKIG